MKKLIYILAIISSVVLVSSYTIKKEFKEPVQYDDYCDGWEDGYCEGWRDIKGQFAICPITPICPLPDIGRDRYRDGYNRGFKAGARAADND